MLRIKDNEWTIIDSHCLIFIEYEMVYLQTEEF